MRATQNWVALIVLPAIYPYFHLALIVFLRISAQAVILVGGLKNYYLCVMEFVAQKTTTMKTLRIALLATLFLTTVSLSVPAQKMSRKEIAAIEKAE